MSRATCSHREHRRVCSQSSAATSLSAGKKVPFVRELHVLDSLGLTLSRHVCPSEICWCCITQDAVVCSGFGDSEESSGQDNTTQGFTLYTTGSPRRQNIRRGGGATTPLAPHARILPDHGGGKQPLNVHIHCRNAPQLPENRTMIVL